jgi:hypothetical protein
MIFDGTVNYRTKDERQVALPFLHVPPRASNPQYYTIIKQPMDLQTVQNRIDKGSYSTIEAFMMDLRLIWHNAGVYNERGSRIQLDADILRRKALAIQRSIFGNVGEDDKGVGGGHTVFQAAPIVDAIAFPSLVFSGSPNFTPRDRNLIVQYLQVFDYLRNFRTSSNRRLCDVLIRYPDQKEHPEYFTLIQSPLDIAAIISRVKSNKYSQLRSFVIEMTTLFENGLLYYRNHPSHVNDIATLYQVRCFLGKENIRSSSRAWNL